MLETGRVRGVAGDGNVHVLLPHDRDAFRDVIGSVALDLRARAVGISDLAVLNHFALLVVHVRFNEGEAVDTGDNSRRVLAETVQDHAKRFLADLIGVVGDADRAFRRREGLMSRKESEAFGILFQQHLAQIAVAESDLSVVCDRSRNAEGLKALADGRRRVRRSAAVLLDGDCRADRIRPLRVLEADRLNVLNHMIDVQPRILADLPGILKGGNAIAVQNFVDLVDSSFVRFK